jgi:hypothetical protein
MFGFRSTLSCGAGGPPAALHLVRPEKLPARRQRHEKPAFRGGSHEKCFPDRDWREKEGKGNRRGAGESSSLAVASSRQLSSQR